ncbi:hypothetical protein INR49_000012 [Caranx melampygus]|nr:hypothetical protein INR49_000012 [Caranx melampygus]
MEKRGGPRESFDFSLPECLPPFLKDLDVTADWLGALAAALQSEDLKGNSVSQRLRPPSSSGSAVLAGILVSGLLLAAGITVGYCKYLRKTDPKGVKLAEDACPVDPENQGNTLVSVAPLNPPPETQRNLV